MPIAFEKGVMFDTDMQRWGRPLSTFIVWVQHWNQTSFSGPSLPPSPRSVWVAESPEIEVCMPRDGSKYSAGWAGRWFPHERNWCVLHTPHHPSGGRGSFGWGALRQGAPHLTAETDTGQVGLALTSPAKRCKSNSPYLAGFFTLQDSDVWLNT